MTKELDKALSELMSWWQSETQEFRDLVVSLLCELPGADDEYRLSELFVTTDYHCGWKEIDMLGRLLMAINNKEDVEKVSERILEIEEGNE